MDHLKIENIAFESNSNDTLVAILREIEDTKSNNTDFKNYLNEKINVSSEQLGNLEQSNDSSKLLSITENITVLQSLKN